MKALLGASALKKEGGITMKDLKMPTRLNANEGKGKILLGDKGTLVNQSEWKKRWGP